MLAALVVVGFGMAPGLPAQSNNRLLRTQDQYHVVQPGENLYRIALKYDVDLKELCELNGLKDPGALEKGQRLRIPRRKQTRVGMYHVVERGESLEAIAAAYQFNARSLANVNRLRAGQELAQGQLIWVPGAMERRSVAKAAPARMVPPPASGAAGATGFHPPQQPSGRRETRETAQAATDWRSTTRPSPPPRNLASGAPAPAPQQNVLPRRAGHYHVVRSGQNLKRIGEQYGITNWEWLAEVNRLPNADSLEVGQRVYIPSLSERPALAGLDSAAPRPVVGASVDYLHSGPFSLARESEDGNSAAGLTAGLPPPAAPPPPAGPAQAAQPVEEPELLPPAMPARLTAVPVEFGWPLTTRAVRTVPFGVERGRTFHKGVDLAAPENTPILAVADGVVEVVGSERDTLGKSLGNYVIISHGMYKNRTCRTVYAHANRVLVRAGERVRKGQVIARVGNTGRSHGGNGGHHLHLELWYGDDCVDPWPVLESKRPTRDENLADAE